MISFILNSLMLLGNQGLGGTLALSLVYETWIWPQGPHIGGLTGLFFFVFILLWTSCPILAKRYLFNSRKYLWTCIIEPSFLFLLLISPLLQWSCFVWVFHFALVTRHGVMWASWSTRLFVFFSRSKSDLLLCPALRVGLVPRPLKDVLQNSE